MHLTSELNESNQRLYEAQSTYGDQLRQLDAERSALREEVSHIAEQLAQRAVLYAAQERRFLDNSRIYQSQYSEQSHEVVGLRARLQQLEEQHQRLENDRLNKELENRQLKDDNSRLQMQVVELQERVFTLDSEIADISAQNITMQATVERLRGSDVEELEVNLTRELEIMRVESRLREEALTKQLEEANRRVESCVVEKESLLDDLQHFRKELHAKDSLISSLEASRQYGNYLITNNTSNLKHELNYSNVQSTSIITSTQNKSASLANLLGENSTIEQQSLYGLSQERSVAVDSSFDAWSINDLFRPTVTSPSRENKIMSHSGIGLDTEYRNLRSSEDDEVVLSNDSLDLKRQEGADLRGEISALDFEISSDESSCEERVPQKQRLKSNNNSVIATEDNLLPSSDAFNSILRKISGTDGDGCNFLERSITRGEFSSIDDRPPRETTEGAYF